MTDQAAPMVPQDDGFDIQRQFVLALHSFEQQQAMQLSMNAGEVIEVVATDESGWWYGQNLRGEEGYFPSNFVAPISLNEEGPSGMNGSTAGMDELAHSLARVKHVNRILVYNMEKRGISLMGLETDPPSIRADSDPVALDDDVTRHCQQILDSLKPHVGFVAVDTEAMARKDAEIRRLQEQLARAEARPTTDPRQTAELEEMKREKADMEEMLQESESEKEKLKKQLAQSRDRFKSLKGGIGQLAVVNDKIKRVKKDMDELKAAVQRTNGPLLRAMSSFERALPTLALRLSETTRRLAQEEAQRRRLYNEVQELKGNIRVICRVRPLGTAGEETRAITEFLNDQTLQIEDEERGKKHPYEFDAVFGPDSQQGQVFEHVKPVICSCLDGYNVCVFAYGQTGSGKTFTMDGSESHPGINRRALDELFNVAADRAPTWQYTFEVSVLEIYNESVYDLLTHTGRPRDNKLDIRFSKGRGVVEVPDLVREVVRDTGDVMETLARGYANRSVGTTNMNQHSSRSHCMLCVWVVGINVDDRTEIRSRLNLIDLAGSERIKRSKAEGETLDEAIAINKSLLALGDVMSALGQKSAHVPYRNSKLTYILQDSLGGNSKVNMIVNISPAVENLSESLSSLNFATKVATVELGQAKKNVGRAGSAAGSSS